MKKIRLIIIGVLFIGLLGGMTLYRIKQNSSAQNSLKKSKANSIPVTVIKPKTSYYSTKLTVSGTLTAEQEIEISPKVTGRLISLNLDEGDYVKAGQTIGEVDHSEIDAQILQAQAQVRVASANLNKSVNGPLKQQIQQAQATLNQAESSVKQLEINKQNLQKDLNNYQTLFNKGIITQQQLNNTQAQTDVINQQINAAKQQVYSSQQALSLLNSGTRPEDIEAGRGQLDNAKSLIKLYQSQLANYHIVSPINGIVTKKLLFAGSLVSPSTSILTLSSSSNPDVILNIPEREIDAIHIGQKVEVKSSNSSEKTYMATIKEINPGIDNQTRLLKAKAKFNSPNNLKFGVLLNCSVVTYEKKNALMLPSDAVLNNNNRDYIYLVVNNKAVDRNVKLGMQDPDNTEIISGLKPDDQVILKGNTFVTPGIKVDVQDNKNKKKSKKVDSNEKK